MSQAAVDDLVKAPSNKLFPFVKLLLAETSLMQSSAAAAATEPTEVQVCSDVPDHREILSLMNPKP